MSYINIAEPLKKTHLNIKTSKLMNTECKKKLNKSQTEKTKMAFETMQIGEVRAGKQKPSTENS